MSFDDDPGPWRCSRSEYLARELWYTVRVDRVELPNGTIIPKYWINEYPPWVNVVAVTERRRVVLIRQYRHGIGAVHFEIPAGTTDPGTRRWRRRRGASCSRRPATAAGAWSPLMTLSANPALQNNLTYTFLAEGVTAGAAAPEASEDIRVHLVPLAEVEALIDERRLRPGAARRAAAEASAAAHGARGGRPPMPMPDEIVGLLRSTITFKWADGHETKYKARDLRLACRCAHVHRGDLRAPAARTATVPDNVRAKGIDLVGQYAIAIEWSDGHTTGIYNFRDLRANCPCADVRGARRAAAACLDPGSALSPSRAAAR